jgi:SAM-dependent methyltransferase
MTEYQFSDTDLAARRLKYLNEVYAESTRDFILDAVGYRPQLASDLGCGPGYTTHFLAELTRCERAVGLDKSENFISLAEQTWTEQVSFCLHDITLVPFPVGPSDLLYCRYLLAHLKNPVEMFDNWASQLQPNGLLLIEEVEWIDSRNKIFTTYLDIVAAMLADQSTELYVGPVLDRLGDTTLLQKKFSRVKQVPVLTHQAATMFYMNIQTWKHQPFIQANYSTEVIAKLESDLKALTTTTNDPGDIEWGLRQLVFERR